MDRVDNIQGPEDPGGGEEGGNQNDTVGSGVPHCSLSKGPQGFATPFVKMCVCVCVLACVCVSVCVC